MARGGARQGQPGKAYPNRRDLQAVKTAPGQAYGEAGQQAAAQQAMPLPNQPTPGGPPTQPTQQAPVTPDSLGEFTGPTQRPDEPVTTGLPVGAGAGPEVMSAAPGPDPVLAQLNALYSISGDPDLLRVIELRQRNA